MNFNLIFLVKAFKLVFLLTARVDVVILGLTSDTGPNICSFLALF